MSFTVPNLLKEEGMTLKRVATKAKNTLKRMLTLKKSSPLNPDRQGKPKVINPYLMPYSGDQ
jgi:hypothetical protein